jgi:hypothetical protein
MIPVHENNIAYEKNCASPLGGRESAHSSMVVIGMGEQPAA